MSKPTPKFTLRAYTKKEIRALYGISVRTFLSWMAPYRKELGMDNKKQYLTVSQVKFIVEKFGIPGEEI